MRCRAVPYAPKYLVQSRSRANGTALDAHSCDYSAASGSHQHTSPLPPAPMALSPSSPRSRHSPFPDNNPSSPSSSTPSPPPVTQSALHSTLRSFMHFDDSFPSISITTPHTTGSVPHTPSDALDLHLDFHPSPLLHSSSLSHDLDKLQVAAVRVREYASTGGAPFTALRRSYNLTAAATKSLQPLSLLSTSKSVPGLIKRKEEGRDDSGER